MSFFQIPAYQGDQRGGKIEAAYKRRGPNESVLEQFLDLCCPDEAVEQIMTCFGGSASISEVPHELRASVSHSLYFEAGYPPGLRDLVYLLKDVVSIPTPVGVDSVVALDWYKQVEDGVDPSDWKDTPMGQCIHYTKYARYPSGSTSRAKREELIQALAGFVIKHPIYSDAGVVTAPPGSEANGRSFAESLARDVAQRVGKSYRPQTAAGPRPQQKEGVNGNLAEAFTMVGDVDGKAIVIDDVYRTGASMAGAAMAARRSGAQAVVALAAVRTMRN